MHTSCATINLRNIWNYSVFGIYYHSVKDFQITMEVPKFFHTSLNSNSFTWRGGRDRIMNVWDYMWSFMLLNHRNFCVFHYLQIGIQYLLQWLPFRPSTFFKAAASVLHVPGGPPPVPFSYSASIFPKQLPGWPPRWVASMESRVIWLTDNASPMSLHFVLVSHN